MRLILFAAVVAIVFACKSDAPVAPKVTGFDGITYTLEDGTVQSIPHAGDPEYAVYILVRHAEKKKDSTDNPALSPEGQERALKLARMLKKVPLARASSTNLKRTLETVEFVKVQQPNPLPTDVFPKDMLGDWLAETLPTAKGKINFHAGHSNTVPQMLNIMSGSLAWKEIPENEYDHLYIAVVKSLGEAEILQFRY
jgi:2,3-bisphosphoglycerate-dependent phosphoglycerate mutase